MRMISALLLASVILLVPLSLHAQQPPRDAQAVALLQRAVVAMGATGPTDSVATGNIVIEAGGKTDSGTVRLLTRGGDQMSEVMQTTDEARALIISGQWGAERRGTTSRKLSMEAVLSAQAPVFPLPFLASALANRDAAFALVGQETLESVAVYHIRIWNTFASNLDLQALAEFSAKDLWLDAVSGLPLKLGCQQREGGGSAGRMALEVRYSDYRNIAGVLYPFRIDKSLNGTPWATVTIQSVAFNTGLSDADFPVR